MLFLAAKGINAECKDTVVYRSQINYDQHKCFFYLLSKAYALA